jgi:cysteine synthase/rhodanese-related sulfurtransferase
MNEHKYLNSFMGRDSMVNYLNPENAPYTPLVELPDEINPYKKDGVRFFAKMMNISPLGQVKAVPAYGMMSQAKKDLKLDCVDAIVEASSGNTSYALSVIAKTFGISKTRSYVSHEISPKKMKVLRLFGIEPVVFTDPLCADASDPESRIYKAKQAGSEKGVFNPGQYSNANNPLAHYKNTAQQIWEQTKGELTVFCAGLGTSGTFTGCSSFFKAQNNHIHCVPIVRSENNMVPGLRTLLQMNEIAFPWKGFASHLIKIGSHDSYKDSLRLTRTGLIAGPSSGLAFAGAKEYVRSLKENNRLDLIRNTNGEAVIVFVCCDNPFLYLDEYFDILEKSEFPKIENEHLLLRSDAPLKNKLINPEINQVKEISPTEAYKLLYADTPENLWKNIRLGGEASMRKDVAIIDLRTDREYEEHHIPGALRVAFHDIDAKLKNDKKLKKKGFVLFVCAFGNTSRLAAWKAEQAGIKAFSLSGGDAEWSMLDLPRIRSSACIVSKNNLLV